MTGYGRGTAGKGINKVTSYIKGYNISRDINVYYRKRVMFTDNSLLPMV